MKGSFQMLVKPDEIVFSFSGGWRTKVTFEFGSTQRAEIVFFNPPTQPGGLAFIQTNYPPYIYMSNIVLSYLV
jgi:hypothetical protein